MSDLYKEWLRYSFECECNGEIAPTFEEYCYPV